MHVIRSRQYWACTPDLEFPVTDTPRSNLITVRHKISTMQERPTRDTKTNTKKANTTKNNTEDTGEETTIHCSGEAPERRKQSLETISVQTLRSEDPHKKNTILIKTLSGEDPPTKTSLIKTLNGEDPPPKQRKTANLTTKSLKP